MALFRFFQAYSTKNELYLYSSLPVFPWPCPKKIRSHQSHRLLEKGSSPTPKPQVCVCVLNRVPSWRSDGLWPSRLLCPWDFPGKNTGVGCHFFLQRIFQTQGLNVHLLRLLHWQADFWRLRHLGSPTFFHKGQIIQDPDMVQDLWILTFILHTSH